MSCKFKRDKEVSAQVRGLFTTPFPVPWMYHVLLIFQICLVCCLKSVSN